MKMLLPVAKGYIPWLLLVGEILHHLGCGKKTTPLALLRAFLEHPPSGAEKTNLPSTESSKTPPAWLLPARHLAARAAVLLGTGVPMGLVKMVLPIWGPPNMAVLPTKSPVFCIANKN